MTTSPGDIEHGGTAGPQRPRTGRGSSTGVAAQVALASIAVALLVLGIKMLAYYKTDSVALYSDALESLVNVATASIAWLAIRISRQPADRRHPFGHHKVEYFSAVIESALIVVAALLILREAYDAIARPRVIAEPAIGILISGTATAINAAWGAFLVSRGRAWRSPALTADGWHVLSDVVTSIGVIVGIGIAVLSGITLLDPLIAAAVAVNILVMGWRLSTASVSGLMDEAVEPKLLDQLRAAISAHAEGAIEVHDLRTRVAASKTFIEFHLVVPATMTVADAHAICDRVEAALATIVADADVLIHVEPEGEARHTGVLVL